jgi:hypothetical protein
MIEDFYRELGRRTHLARPCRRMSQADRADAAPRHRPSMSRILTGLPPASVPTIKRIAAALATGPSALIRYGQDFRWNMCRKYLDLSGTRPPRESGSFARGTEGSNPPSSSTESVSAVNPGAVGDKPRTLAAVCAWLGREEGGAGHDSSLLAFFL